MNLIFHQNAREQQLFVLLKEDITSYIEFTVGISISLMVYIIAAAQSSDIEGSYCLLANTGKQSILIPTIFKTEHLFTQNSTGMCIYVLILGTAIAVQFFLWNFSISKRRMVLLAVLVFPILIVAYTFSRQNY